MTTTNLTNIRANAWTNVVTTIISTTGSSGGPKISSISYPGDDAAADVNGGQTITLTGSGFNSGASVIINGTYAGVVTVVSSTSITFTAPAQSAGTYAIYVVNTDGGTAIAVPGISYSGTPTWSNTAGSIATVYEASSISSQLGATGDAPITYSVYSGTLPPGSSLNTTTGLISGTSPATASPTTYSFTIRATDAQKQDTDRAFSITVNPDVVTWSSPADNSTTTTYEYVAITPVSLSATSAAGKSITYTANALPTGVTLSGSTISGTPTTVANTNTRVTANAASTYRTATKDINFVVNQDVVTWNTPANNTVFSQYTDTAITPVTLSATSAAGFGVTYAANTLPTGLTLSGGVISGTPTVVGNTDTLITATAATTNRTTVATFSWVVTVGGDPYFKNTTLLLSANTDVISTPLINDKSLFNAQITVFGDCRATNFNPYSEGYYSNYFDGTGDYITAQSITLGTNPFTIEFWAYPTSIPTNAIIFGTATNGGIQLQTDSAGNMSVGTYGVSNTLSTSGTPFVTNRWLHIVVVRSGTGTNQTSVYFNGVRYANGTVSTNYVAGTATIGGLASQTFFGYISNFRLVVGTALYDPTQTTITVPTSPLTAVANTQLLTCCSNRFLDKSTNATTITVTGNVSVSPEIPFAAPNNNYGSIYFDGTGDYVMANSNPAYAFGAASGTSNDFTAECWAYFTAIQSAQSPGLMSVANSASSTGWQVYYDPSSGWGVRSNAANIFTNASPPVVGRWYHVAYVRAGSTHTLYINGVSIATSTTAATWSDQVFYSGYTPIGQNVYGYVSDVRLVKGVAVYTGNFTPPTSPLAISQSSGTNIAAVSAGNTSILLFQNNGSHNNNHIKDSANAMTIITRAGNVQAGTFSPYGDNWSVYFNGSSDFLTVSGTTTLNVASTGAYTIESWVYPTGSSSYSCIASKDWGPGTTYASFTVYLDASRKVNFSGGSGTTSATGAFGFTGVNAVALNTWSHIAVVVSAGTWKIYINGLLDATGSMGTGVVGVSTNAMIVGGSNSGGSGTAYFIGHLCDTRITKSAIYTANTSTSTTPLLADTNTQILVCNSNRFIDKSYNAYALTATGAPRTIKFSPYATINSSLPKYYSYAFGSTSNYLSVTPKGTVFPSSGNSWTVEGWFMFKSFAAVCGLATVGDLLEFKVTSSTQIQAIYRNTPASPVWTTFTGTYSFNTYTWYHIALVNNNGSLQVYVNGTSTGTAAAVGAMADGGTGANAMWIGGNDTFAFANLDQTLNGYISNFRTANTAVYTGNFTVPTTPLAITQSSGTNISALTAGQVKLLTCHENIISDGTSNNIVITSTANTALPISPFTVTTSSASYSPTIFGGSIYFDGTGDYITIPTTTTSAATNLGASGDFTIEAWIYNTSTAATSKLIFGNWNAGSNGGYQLYLRTNNRLVWQAYTQNSPDSATLDVPVNAWTHVAWVRMNNVAYLYINGVLKDTTALTNSCVGLASAVSMGAQDTSLASNYFPGYISDLRITKKALYTSNFWPGPTPLTTVAYANNRTDASNTYTASMLISGASGGMIDATQKNNIETIGDVHTVPFSPYSGNYYSNYFDGTGDYLTFPNSSNFAFGTGAFTIEFWINGPLNNDKHIVNGRAAIGTMHITTGGSASTAGSLRYVGSSTITTGSVLITDNLWHHCAIVRDGSNNVTLYVDGVSQGTGTDTTNYTSTSGTWFIASNDSSVGGAGTNTPTAYISNLRIVKGTAIIPSAGGPTSPLTAVSGTSLLTCQSNKLKDSSVNNNVLTKNGDVSVKSTNPFRVNTGLSYWFDGNGDRLAIPYSIASPALLSQVGAFTFECWFMMTTQPGVNTYLLGRNAGGFFGIAINSSNILIVDKQGVGTQITGTTTLKLGQWYHIAMSYDGTYTRLFLDGVLEGTVAGTGGDGSAATTIAYYEAATSSSFYGYISDIRFTKFARYSSNTTFTVPTTPVLGQ
jgi:hypothetical protein